jgi:hypothetical protein
VNAVTEMGWSAPAKVQAGYASRGEPSPDLSIRVASREFQVVIRELDERGRPGRAFITQTDYLTHAERTIANKSFSASGKLEVTLTRGWERHPVLSQRDTGKSTLEDQLPALIRSLEIDKAEADWARQEEERRSEIREERWKEVKREASSTWPTSATPTASSPTSPAATPQRRCAHTPTRSPRTPLGWRPPTR